LLFENGRRRVVIEGVKPEVDAGRFPVKRVLGERVVVEADIFADGHDALSASLLYRKDGAAEWRETPMQPLVNDRWRGEFAVTELGRYRYSVQGWVDHFKTWRRDMAKRIQASADTELDYQEGALLIEGAAARASGADGDWLRGRAADLRAGRKELALDDALAATVARYPDKTYATPYERELLVKVDRERARFSAWYEFFPRSAGERGTFADAETMLPYVARMGFDVVYVPPVHPIGRKHRKGKNNVVTAEPDDTGSPWAIGSDEGGHKSVHPGLGSIEDFRRFAGKVREHGMELAIDVAFQAAPDHPSVKAHPEWFRKLPDGSIRYAENPPKKYQDIYPFDFDTEEWRSMWEELKSIFDFWIEQGIKIFRVDNPHTKAFPFWEWCITEIQREHSDTIFLSEAFTRPKVMYRLAKVGFTQSYTYFPWRNTSWEIRQYFTEITQTDVREFFRPNHWPNTPDILTEFLQTTGRPGFMVRLVLAATLGANYGVYGPAFELQESQPREPGSEEYRDSEKYQVRRWDLKRPDSLANFMALVNRIRRENPALHSDWSLRFHESDNPNLLFYSKSSEDGSNIILVVANLDPFNRQSGWLRLDPALFGGDTQPFQLHDLLTGVRYIWHGDRNYVDIDPQMGPAQVLRVRRRVRTEREFEYFL
jgi:starch synthase (maltosyl-transferring)